MRKDESATVRVVVHNEHDSVAMEWTVFTRPLMILSTPDIEADPADQYVYALDVAAPRTERITYAIARGPKWMSVDEFGVVQGVVDSEAGMFPVEVTATDPQGNSDTQSYVLHVTGLTAAHPTALVPSTAYVGNFPNPFSSATVVSYHVPRDATVSLHVYDLEGRHLRTLLHRASTLAGMCTLWWDGMDAAGVPVPSGPYILALKIRPLDGSATIVTQHTISVTR